ncbi:chloride channel protein [Azospirillum baldaniorum]|uniref:chloride channel protein n=1 Tax=Azospirillum baldaniorum TaxID=1064539 RepID=UPI000697F67A|nr:chloride channel protein [Azospirillum baldaniorum]
MLTRRSLRDSVLGVLMLAGAIGAGVGLAVAMLHEAVVWTQSFVFSVAHGQDLGEAALSDPWRTLLVPAVGGLLLGVMVKLVRRWRSNDIVDPVEANALYGGKMSLIDSLRLTLATLLSNGSGASVGMEAAYTQAGSGIASTLGQKLRLRRADLRTLVGCGAAAAISAAYGAPLAGAFYAFELVMGGYTIATLAPIGAASVAAVAVAHWLTDPSPVLFFGRPVAVEGWDYVACGVLGFLAGWLSILAMQAVTVAERGFRALPIPVWARPALGGLALGALALVVPQVLGAGPGADPSQLARGLEAMAILLVAKIVASALSLGSGFRGGLFSASLLLGGLFGGLAYGVVELLVPGLGLDRMLLVLAGMGAVAAGIIGAPVTMVLLVLEATQDFWAASGRTYRRGGVDHRGPAGFRLFLRDVALPPAWRADPRRLRRRLGIGADGDAADARRREDDPDHPDPGHAAPPAPAGRRQDRLRGGAGRVLRRHHRHGRRARPVARRRGREDAGRRTGQARR